MTANSAYRHLSSRPPVLMIGLSLAWLFSSQTVADEPTSNLSTAKPATLPTITVESEQTTPAHAPIQGYVADSSESANKTDTPWIEIPQSISIIGKNEITAHAAQSVTQAVAYTPGILSGLYGPSTRDDYLNLRGFTATQFLDGTRLMSSNTSYAQLRVDPYDLERVEVLRGPSSVLYGQNPPGGLVNMTSKRPTETPFHEMQLSGGSFDRIQGALDLSGPVTGRDDLLYRIVGVARGSGTQVDHVDDDRYFIAPSFTWRNDVTSLTFLSHYQKDETGNAMQFLPYEGTVLPNPNGQIPSERFLGDPGYDNYEREQFAVGYALEHAFSDTLKARQNFRYADVDSNYQGLYPDNYWGSFARPTDNPELPVESDPNLRQISRYGSAYQDKTQTVTLDNHLQADLTFGATEHTLLAGLDFRHFDARRRNGTTDYDLPELFFDVYNPVYGVDFAKPELTNRFRSDLSQVGIYGQDQIKWRQWLLTVSIRQDWASSQTHQKRDGEITDTTQDDEAFTYRTALGYQFDNGIAPYYSYSESFDPAIGADRLGNVFKPTTGQQHEVGIKYQPPGYNAYVSVSAYHLVQQNVLTPDLTEPDNPQQKQTGEVVAHGMELEGKASLANGLDITAGYAYTATEVTKTEETSEQGKWLTYTPKHQASLWLDYTQPNGAFSGVGMGAGTRYVGMNYGDLSNSQKAPSYVLADLAAHYDLSKLDARMKGLRLSVNVNNLLDKTFVVTCGDGYCFYGERRTVLASLRYNW